LANSTDSEPITVNQLKKAAAIFTFDKAKHGEIKAWVCGIHKQQTLAYFYSDGKVTAKCDCGASNSWEVPTIDKIKECLICGSLLTEKEAAENPEPICDECYKIGEDDGNR
jgi:hypothetical protein